ncbi:MAG: HYR domain-containing protein [Bacteroidetes bacterium]|nr:HYR domain-containing protein [Bacteroidota bacterium]
MVAPIYKQHTRRTGLIFSVLLVAGFALATTTSTPRLQTLDCPDDYSILLPAGQCGIAINYSSLVWSSTVPLVDTVFFPFPGTFLETGTTTVTLAVVDVNGNIASCEFNVTIIAANTMQLNCPSQVAVSLEGNCQRPLTASDILGFACDSDYLAEMLGDSGNWVPAILDANLLNQPFTVQLTNFETGASCETEIIITGGLPAGITCPPDITINCNEPTDTLVVGGPVFSGCFDSVGLVFFDDIIIPTCPEPIGYQITRTWISTDPFGHQTACEQVITGMRYNIALVEFPPDFDGIENPPIACNDTLNLTQTASPDVTGIPIFDNYAANSTLRCKIAVSYLDEITPLCGDSYEIRRAWSVVELCTPITRRDTQIIVVVDAAAPEFEIPDTLFFSLSADCTDSVFLPSVNLLAECSGYDISITTPWDTMTTDGGWIFPDTLPGDYPVVYTLTDDCGNVGAQELILRIAGETLVTCPPDDTISCDYYFGVISPALQIGDFQTLAQLGLPTFHSNCDFDLEETDSVEVDACGNGFIERRISTVNTTDSITCVQLITVQHQSLFEVQFPADTSICVSLNQANLPDPQLFMVTCEAVSVTSSDMVIPSGLAGCFTVQRTWVVINGCVFTGDTSIPDPEVSVRRFGDGGDGHIEYVQVIHVNNNAAVTFPNGCEIADKFVGADCEVDFTVPVPVVNGCGDDISLTVSGSLGTTLGAPVSALPGTYQVTYKATDECGKMQTCSTSFVVFDTVAPVAVCHAQLVVEVFPPGSVDVWSPDFDNGSTDNCTTNLQFSFSPDPTDIQRTYDCCQLGLVEIELWVTDGAGNQSTCQSNLIITSPGNCECEPILAGTVEKETGEGIHNVLVTIDGTNGFFQEIETETNGSYDVSSFNGGDFEITPSKNTNPLNGVTTFDIVLIRKHILGVDTLDSPYKIIAADINNSGTVTTFDLVELRKLILFINTSFPANTSWRFVDAAYVFPNPLDPFQPPFPESIMVNDVIADQLNLDFIGIKIGDVNGNAATSPLQPDEGGEEKN